MHWGLKSRFHDLEKVLKVKPKVEFHLTEEDVKEGNLDKEIYGFDYSIHLPEYWGQELIDPCNINNLPHNLDVYRMCIKKGLSLKNNFAMTEDYFLNIEDTIDKTVDIRFVHNNRKLKVIMHPGAMTVDPLNDGIHPTYFYKNNLYRRLNSFLTYIEMFPEIKNKIELLVENMPPLPWFYGGQYYSNIFCDPEEIANSCEIRNRRFCLDISHLGLYCNYTNRNLIESIKLLKPYIAQIHLADAKGTDGEGANMGEGNIDFEAVINEIKDLDVCVIPEQMWGHRQNYYEFKRTIEECNRWLI